MKFISSQVMKVAAVCALSGMVLSASATPVGAKYSPQSKDQGGDKGKEG